MARPACRLATSQNMKRQTRIYAHDHDHGHRVRVFPNDRLETSQRCRVSQSVKPIGVVRFQDCVQAQLYTNFLSLARASSSSRSQPNEYLHDSGPQFTLHFSHLNRDVPIIVSARVASAIIWSSPDTIVAARQLRAAPLVPRARVFAKRACAVYPRPDLRQGQIWRY